MMESGGMDEIDESYFMSHAYSERERERMYVCVLRPSMVYIMSLCLNPLIEIFYLSTACKCYYRLTPNPLYN